MYGRVGVECRVGIFSRRIRREGGRKRSREKDRVWNAQKTAGSGFEDFEVSVESSEGGVGDGRRKRGSWDAGGCLTLAC